MEIINILKKLSSAKVLLLKIFISISILLTSNFQIYSQSDSLTAVFFRDSLQGRWILDTTCALEFTSCDSTKSEINYIIFDSIDTSNNIYYKMDLPQLQDSDTTLLYLPISSYLGMNWEMKNFLGSNSQNLILNFTDKSHLDIYEKSVIGFVYKLHKDSSYTSTRIKNNEENRIVIYSSNNILSINSLDKKINSIRIISQNGITVKENKNVNSYQYVEKLNKNDILICIIIFDDESIITKKVFVK